MYMLQTSFSTHIVHTASLELPTNLPASSQLPHTKRPPMFYTLSQYFTESPEEKNKDGERSGCHDLGRYKGTISFFFNLFLFFGLFRAAPKAYGESRARG